MARSHSEMGEEREKRRRKDQKEKKRLLKNSGTDHCRPDAWSK